MSEGGKVSLLSADCSWIMHSAKGDMGILMEQIGHLSERNGSLMGNRVESGEVVI